MEDYRSVIREILDLNWESLDSEELQKLMILSAFSALEFADTLRLTVKLNPKNNSLRKMADEELNTDNLSFKDYKKRGDHAQFLWYFINKYNLTQKFPDIKKAGEKYIKKVKSLSSEVRVMSIVSRENELPGIFTRVLTAKKWKAEGLPEFKYYIKRHIFLDSHEGGHADMLSNFKIDDNVANFYKIRLEMYRSIPKLFNR